MMHIENPGIIRTVYLAFSTIFRDIQQYSALFRHIQALPSYIEPYSDIFRKPFVTIVRAYSRPLFSAIIAPNILPLVLEKINPLKSSKMIKNKSIKMIKNDICLGTVRKPIALFYKMYPKNEPTPPTD